MNLCAFSLLRLREGLAVIQNIFSELASVCLANGPMSRRRAGLSCSATKLGHNAGIASAGFLYANSDQ